MGLEGFTGNESILYHLESPCRVKELGAFTPIEREEWIPEKHAHRLQNTYDVSPEGDEISGRRTLMWNADVEISFCRPKRTMDYFFRNGEGDEVVFVHEGRGTLETIFGDVPYKDGDYVVIPRGTTYRFMPEGEQRYLVFETPGLIEIPRRYRNEYGQILEGAPYYHRDIHPPTDLHTRRERGEFLVKVRVRGGYQDYVLDYHPFDVVGLGRLPLPVDVLDPRLRADHGAHPSAAAVAPDVPGAELRHLLVLSAEARLRSRGGADPLPPLESPVGGDDLLRLRELRLAEGDLGRRDHAPSFGPSARAAAGARREVARRRGDDRARRDVRHVQTAQALDVRARPRRRALRATRGTSRRRTSRASPASRATCERRPLPRGAPAALRGLPALGASDRPPVRSDRRAGREPRAREQPRPSEPRRVVPRARERRTSRSACSTARV